MTPRNFISTLSLKQIILVGLIVRLLAVFFSPGYAFHDDHFEMAELVFKWKDGVSFLWTGTDVHVFSLIYPGFVYLIFEACHSVGIDKPEHLLLVTRLVHALISLVSIYYGYKLCFRLTGRKDSSNLVALMFALFWLFPFMSVRNLREFFCVPFLMIASYHIADPKLTIRSIILSALFFALAFSIRLQIVFIPLGIGICLLLKKHYATRAIAFGIACVAGYMLTQGLFDLIYYGDPFASVKEYTRFNSDPANIMIQPQGPWYHYIGTVAGVVWGLPFLVLAWGYGYSAKMSFQLRMFFIATILFFAFHSYYSNKQERFILPFIVYFLILGIIGFNSFYQQWQPSRWMKKVISFVIIWFLVLNTAGMLVLCFTYTKRSRVESMIYLRNKGDVKNIMMVGDAADVRPPLFYLGKHLEPFTFPDDKKTEQMQYEIDTASRAAPNYIILAGTHDLNNRLNRLRVLFPGLTQETTIKSGFVDNLAYRINPKHNKNEDWLIYRVQ